MSYTVTTEKFLNAFGQIRWRFIVAGPGIKNGRSLNCWKTRRGASVAGKGALPKNCSYTYLNGEG